MAHHKSVFLLFVIVCVNAAFGQNATAALTKEFEIKYFAPVERVGSMHTYHAFNVATIESAEEQKYVEGLINELGPQLQKLDFWIAGTDLANEGLFNWYTTGEPLRYKNFQKGQPDNFKQQEHCLLIYGLHRGADKLQWNDWPCNNLNFFICEKKPKCER